MGTGNYSATSNNMTLVLAVDGWAVTYGTARRGLGGAQAHHCCTKCNSLPINGQSPSLCGFNVPIKGLNAVPQGSILGPLLFVIFINDLDDGVINKLLKFADDTKIVSKVGTAEDVKVLQDDLHKLFQ